MWPRRGFEPQHGEPNATGSAGQLFDEKRRDALLQNALKKAKAQKGKEFPFAFGMMGDQKSILVVDWRGQFDLDKLVKEMRKAKPQKMIVGKATVIGKVLQLKVEQKKGTVKPKDVRDFLNSKSGLSVSKATILGEEEPNAESAGKSDDKRGRQRGR